MSAFFRSDAFTCFFFNFKTFSSTSALIGAITNAMELDIFFLKLTQIGADWKMKLFADPVGKDIIVSM